MGKACRARDARQAVGRLIQPPPSVKIRRRGPLRRVVRGAL